MRYTTLLLFMIVIVIGVVATVASPEFFNDPYGLNIAPRERQKPTPLIAVKQSDLDMIYQEQMIKSDEAGFQLQPTVASTSGITFLTSEPRMPNHFITTVGRELISYSI